MLIYSIFQLPSWFFFWGGSGVQEIRLAKTRRGRYNIPIGKAPPKVGGFQGKEPAGWFFPPFRLGRCGSTPCLFSFRSFGPCCRMFFFVLNKFPRRFCFVCWLDIFAGFSGWCGSIIFLEVRAGQKRGCWSKICLLFKINILDVMVDVIFLLGIAGSHINAARWNKMEANCAFFPFKQQEKTEGIVRQDCVISCEEIENSEDMEKFYKPS